MSSERCRVKIAILSRDGTLYSCKRLRDAAAKRGHQVEILDPMSCYMNIDPAASSIHYKGRKLPHFDAVIPRIGSQITYYGTAALRQFEMLGSYPLNESVAPATSCARCSSSPVRGSISPSRGLPIHRTTPAILSTWWAARLWSSSWWKARRALAWCWLKRVRRRRA